jgi:nitroreductase
LLVLCRITNLDDKYIDRFIDSMAKQRWVTKESLLWYEQRVKWYLANLDEDIKKNFSSKQVYIALWNLLTVLALKKIDGCAVAWFIPEKYDEILKLKEKWLASVVALPIWYRSDNDNYAKAKKVRFSREEVVEVI